MAHFPTAIARATMPVVRLDTMNQPFVRPALIRPRRLLPAAVVLVLTALILGGCQSAAPDDGPPLPVKVPDPVVDMQAYQLPGALGDLSLVGDAQREGGPGRLFFYQSPSSAYQARVTLYPLAGGWDTLPPDRVVAGQYGIIRQQLLARLGRRGYGAITGSDEGLYDTEHSDYPIAAVILRSADDPQKPVHIVMLAVALPVFIRVEREVPPDQAAELAAETRDWLEARIEALSVTASGPAGQQPGEQ